MSSTWGLATFSCGRIISSIHPTRADFLPSLILPICDRAGGQAWFSLAKKSSRSPSHIWDAMNNQENREQSFLSNDSWSWVLDCLEIGWRKENCFSWLDLWWASFGSQAVHWHTWGTAPASWSGTQCWWLLGLPDPCCLVPWDHCCHHRKCSPSLSWYGRVTSHLKQMPVVYALSAHGAWNLSSFRLCCGLDLSN